LGFFLGLCCFVGFGFEGLPGFRFVGLGLEGLGFPLVLEPLVYSRAPFAFNKLLFIKYIYIYI
jgi:hypothetical protein